MELCEPQLNAISSWGLTLQLIITLPVGGFLSHGDPQSFTMVVSMLSHGLSLDDLGYHDETETSTSTIDFGSNCLGFFPLWFFLDLLSVRFPCYLQRFGAGSCHFNCLCNILELEPLIFHRICNILVELVAFWSWKLLFQRYLQHF